jgi:hypothetical protein
MTAGAGVIGITYWEEDDPPQSIVLSIEAQMLLSKVSVWTRIISVEALYVSFHYDICIIQL